VRASRLHDDRVAHTGAVVMQDRNGAQVEQVVLNRRPMLRVIDRHGFHVGCYRTVEELAQVVDVASLVEVHP
jgi:hypothetical protein